MNDDTRIIDAVRRWVEEVVVGLDLCPFAQKPLERGTLGFRISWARTDNTLYKDTVNALDAFLQADPAQESTTLVICPNALADFDHFNDFLGDLEDNLEDTGLATLVQLVGFHPDYRFQDADPNDAANYTNRSPWPMFHFIRPDEMEAALAHTPDPAAIPQANIVRLRALGLPDLAERLARIKGC
jgi:uncharacterized protein